MGTGNSYVRTWMLNKISIIVLLNVIVMCKAVQNYGNLSALQIIYIIELLLQVQNSKQMFRLTFVAYSCCQDPP